MSSQRSEKLSIINEESSKENEILENMAKVDATETTVTETATEAVTDTATETATEAVTETATETATEAATETATESATETATETATENATKTAIRLKKDPIKDYLDENLKTVFIPKYLQRHFKCTVGTHVFINNPWKKVSRKKIIDNLQLQKTNSCFWKFRKQIEAITNDDVLVGYKSSSSTDEEFLLCTTDKAREYIEEAQKRVQIELEQQVERSMNRLIGPWDPQGSEKDIEDLKPVTTCEKIKYKWKIPKRRIQVDAGFDNSNSKSVRNQYVKLKPQAKEIFEMSDMVIMGSNRQAKSETVNREMQTIPKIKDNKCIQSIIEEEQINQPQPIMKTEKVLDDFLLKNVPDVMTQLQYNELYDLYRDDYKQMKDENKAKIENVDEVIRIHPGYQNEMPQKKYVSSITWHPTIVGVFAVSYMSNSNELVKQVGLKNTDEEPTESNVKNKQFSIISYTEDGDDQDNWNKQPNVKFLDNNYEEKFLYFLNREFVQKIKILQITEDEKMSQGYMNDTDEHLRQTLIYDSNDSNDLLSTYNEFIGEEYNHDDDVISNHTDYSVSHMTTNRNPSETDVCHHDSDTESFYNIWGEDNEWLYNNELRNVVRNIHRNFNKKYNREAKEEKLFELLMSETEKKKKNEETKKDKMKLAKDMFEAGDKYKISKSKQKTKRKLNKQYALIQNDQESMIKRESTPLIDEQNNSVIVWSISDNVFPQLRLESPEEVKCVEFNPRNGNVIVGGLTNGQVCIWDIEGKLEAMGLNLSMSEKEKQHKKHLHMHMKWSLDVNFKTRIRPTALSAITESHESTVTAIQWIHPMTKITSLGKLIPMQQGTFSDQFMSASLDGTIKVWDLQSKFNKKPYQKSETNSRFGRPKNLMSNKSPLSHLNNRLRPSYSIIIREPENPMQSTTYSPITAMSFEIPSMQYKYICQKPLQIGKRQFEYVPVEPSNPNRTLVVGTIMGQIGVVTWEGYDTYPPDGNVEECTHIWWGQIHDGPINCIRRNVFLPDIHLVCGGKVASIWSLKYNNGPIWWKRFNDFTNSVLWSTTHPAKFRVSFNNSGVIQFWNLGLHTHQPYYIADIFLKDGLIASLSSPYPASCYMGIDSVMFAHGVNDMMNYKKNRIICFSDSAGTVMVMTIRASILKPNEIEEVGSRFQKELDWLTELDDWNDMYKRKFGPLGEYDMDDHDYKAMQSDEGLHAVTTELIQPILSQNQTKKTICDETFNWYINRRGPQTRLGKLKDEYIQREKRYMVEAMMKKKNVTQKQFDEYYDGIMNKSDSKTEEISKIRSEADKKYRDIINKLLAADHTDEYKFDAGLKRKTVQADQKLLNVELQKLWTLDIKIEREKFINYMTNNHYKSEEVNWDQVFDFVNKEDKNILNDPNIFKKSNLRVIRQKMLEKFKYENEIN